jgi:hypothetical protein
MAQSAHSPLSKVKIVDPASESPMTTVYEQHSQHY